MLILMCSCAKVSWVTLYSLPCVLRSYLLVLYSHFHLFIKFSNRLNNFANLKWKILRFKISCPFLKKRRIKGRLSMHRIKVKISPDLSMILGQLRKGEILSLEFSVMLTLLRDRKSQKILRTILQIRVLIFHKGNDPIVKTTKVSEKTIRNRLSEDLPLKAIEPQMLRLLSKIWTWSTILKSRRDADSARSSPSSSASLVLRPRKI